MHILGILMTDFPFSDIDECQQDKCRNGATCKVFLRKKIILRNPDYDNFIRAALRSFM